MEPSYTVEVNSVAKMDGTNEMRVTGRIRGIKVIYEMSLDMARMQRITVSVCSPDNCGGRGAFYLDALRPRSAIGQSIRSAVELGLPASLGATPPHPIADDEQVERHSLAWHNYRI